MSKTIDIKEIERRAQRAFYEDGFIDILFGGYLILLALILNIAPTFTIFWAFLVFTYEPLSKTLKERYVYPRMGYAQYPEIPGSSNKQAIGVIVAGVIGLFAILFILVWGWGVIGWNLWFGWIAPLTFGMLLAIGPFVTAGQLTLKRYYLFGVIPILIGIFVPFLFPVIDPSYSSLLSTVALEMIMIGIPAEISGIWLLIKFLKKYPIQPEDTQMKGG